MLSLKVFFRLISGNRFVIVVLSPDKHLSLLLLSCLINFLLAFLFLNQPARQWVLASSLVQHTHEVRFIVFITCPLDIPLSVIASFMSLLRDPCISRVCSAILSLVEAGVQLLDDRRLHESRVKGCLGGQIQVEARRYLTKESGNQY